MLMTHSRQKYAHVNLRALEHVSPERILEFWGRHNLKRWPKRVLNQVEIPTRSKRFLLDVGMPRTEQTVLDWLVRFDDRTNELPKWRWRPGFRVIGYDEGDGPYCIDETHRGRVVALDKSPSKLYLVNSSVERLAQFLTVLQNFYQRLDDVRLWKGEHGVRQFIDSLERRLRRLDAPALADYRSNVWPKVIDEIKWL
jgi:hypothetical protein